ncbi:hypothetical protein AXG93_731s1070 [Marchantia polymorpha subsp. ruderalis]|uniref:Reverse transcriptase RNase H-like domain-containing protein n=1 Tax=Marchantia polymorpha subsp. ruderalis TaxID=1480154 RepID=A0A176VNT2_MARPO|nr:hypothetical protein AXG93_731s1070 [Marchantia polymorpha subsp. ruderalis]
MDLNYLTWVVSLDLAQQRRLRTDLIVSTSLVSSLPTGKRSVRGRPYQLHTDWKFNLVTNHQPLKWLMESDKLTCKFALWVFILWEYDFQVMHRPEVANLDADGLNRNLSTSYEYDNGAKWHGDVDEEMISGWHASYYLCWLDMNSSLEGYVAACPSEGTHHQTVDLEEDDGIVNRQDIHHDVLMLEFLRTSRVPGTMSAKQGDRIS